MDKEEDVECMPEITLEQGKTYTQVAYMPGRYDIEYISNAEVYKITKKSYMMVDNATGKTYRVPIGSVLGVK